MLCLVTDRRRLCPGNSAFDVARRRLVEQVRGTLLVASDQGTVWTVKFPLILASEPVEAAV